MFYKPKFCCNCGEKVERRDWKPWSSTRFCELCESDFKVRDWLPRTVVAIGLAAGVFGLGSYLQKNDKPLNITRNAEAAKLTGTPNTVGNTAGTSGPVYEVPPAADDAANQTNPPKLLEIQQNTASETVYFCGAKTKKGKPCTRLVKGGGRCWQHKSKPAMLPQEKLLAGK